MLHHSSDRSHCGPLYAPSPSQYHWDKIWSSGEWILGVSQELGRGVDVKATGIYLHPEFHRKDLVADYALVRLERPIEHTQFLINLPEPKEYDWLLVKKYNDSVVAMETARKEEEEDWKIKEGHFVLFIQASYCQSYSPCCLEITRGLRVTRVCQHTQRESSYWCRIIRLALR